MKKFHIISCHVLWREICFLSSTSPNLFTFKFLQQGLHDTPDRLRAELQQAIDETPDEYDAILLGYGLCSNGIEGIQARNTRLVVMRGHDCITFFLGSKERYQEQFDNFPGTYWYTPGWIETSEMPGEQRYQNYLQQYIEKYGEDNAQYLMEMEQSWINNYSRAGYVDLGFFESQKYKNYTRECADWLGWKFYPQKGDPRLLKNFLNGNWDTENFLVLEPGEMIVAAYDQQVIDKKQINETQ